MKLAPAFNASLATPSSRSTFSEKVDLLLGVANEALKAGANFIFTGLFLVNEQKYFASSDGSYIDQDVHRIWPNFGITVVNQQTGKFETRNGLSAPMGMGWEYLAARPAGRVAGPTAVTYGTSYDMGEDARNAARGGEEKMG